MIVDPILSNITLLFIFINYNDLKYKHCICHVIQNESMEKESTESKDLTYNTEYEDEKFTALIQIKPICVIA